MLREVAHFLRVAPTAWRLQRRMSFLDCYDLIERDLDDAGKRQYRAALVADLDGLVVEIGIGAGLMLPHYPPGIRVVATEPNLAVLPRAPERAGLAPARIALVAADAGSLPFPPATFDAAVSASVLCSVPSFTGTLRELHRVLRPGGRLRLLEHVRSDRPAAGLLMDAFNPVCLFFHGSFTPEESQAAARRGDWEKASVGITDYTRVDPGCAPPDTRRQCWPPWPAGTTRTPGGPAGTWPITSKTPIPAAQEAGNRRAHSMR